MARRARDTARARVIDRTRVGRVGGLHLRARKPVAGYYSGIHKSPYHGFNVEFAEYREYNPGDDLRFIDWRVLARADRVFIKQFEAETNLNCTILLDVSASMDFSTDAETRLDYGASLAAALTLLLLRQGDQVGLVTFDTAVRDFIPPRGHARHFRAVVETLERATPGGDTDLAGVLHEIAERIRRRSLVIVISDFFDDVEAVLNGLQHFCHRRHEVIVFHLLDPAEIDFPFERITLFEGLEGDAEIVVDPRVMRAGYRNAFAAYLDSLRRGCTEKGVDYERILLNEPFDRALTAYLARRD
jgi:uncharacterized protein (DUF58 family)